MIGRLIVGGLLIVAACGIDPAPVRAADPAVIVEPTELARRPDLVGREVLVDDRIRYFLESKRGQGYDELILKRTEVPFRLGLGARFARPPSEPNAVVRAVLKVVDGRLIGDVITVDLLPADAERLDREVGRTRPDDFAARRTWALWAERRGRELNDPKLEARGVALEGEAFTTEANRPGADAIALADAAAGRPIPPTVRNAIYHRGFRVLAVQAQTPAALDDLARRVRAALPRAADPVAGATATPTDADPAAAYRAATAEEQARLDRRLYADILAHSLDLRLLADPAQAVALADEATRTLPDRPGVADKLRRRGLAEAERGVATMRQSEVEELARTFRADGQEDRARRVLEEWLADRRKNRLSPSDAEGRVLLAANYEKLLGDRTTAGALLAEAAAIEPESRAIADAFLRLGYRKGDNGWFDPTVAANPTTDRPAMSPSPTATAAGVGVGGEGDSLRGLTRTQARARMGGKPDRVVRSATQGMIVEQWVYRTGKTDQFVLFRIDAATTDPRVFASYAITRK